MATISHEEQDSRVYRAISVLTKNPLDACADPGKFQKAS